MNIHEYQAKAILRQQGVRVPEGREVLRAEEAKAAAGELDGPIWVVKAQIHAGGRGKGRFREASAGGQGGVRIARSVSEAAEEAERMLGRTLVTHQTGPAGKQVNRVYIEEGSDHRPRALPRAARRPHHRRASPSSLDRGRHGHRGGRRHDAGEGADLRGRSGDRRAAPPRPQGRLRARARGRPGQAVRPADRHALPGVHVEGLLAARDQPARRRRRRQPALPRLQDELRRERALPAPGRA